MKEDEIPYFQRQSSLSTSCGLCAVNNLLGSAVYLKKDFNDICNNLDQKSWINPHKNIFGGDYDINVLEIALLNAGYECKWLKIKQ